jgi:hypothetical protein
MESIENATILACGKTDKGGYHVKENWWNREAWTVKGNLWCKREKNSFCENHLHGCGRMFLAFTYKLHKK